MKMLPPSPLAESVQHISAVHKEKKEKMTRDSKSHSRHLLFWHISCEKPYHGSICGISSSSRKLIGWEKSIASKWDLQALNLFPNYRESFLVFMACFKIYPFIQSRLNRMFFKKSLTLGLFLLGFQEHLDFFTFL